MMSGYLEVAFRLVIEVSADSGPPFGRLLLRWLVAGHRRDAHFAVKAFTCSQESNVGNQHRPFGTLNVNRGLILVGLSGVVITRCIILVARACQPGSGHIAGGHIIVTRADANSHEVTSPGI